MHQRHFFTLIKRMTIIALLQRTDNDMQSIAENLEWSRNLWETPALSYVMVLYDPQT